MAELKALIPMARTQAASSSSLADLPVDELRAYGRDLGLSADPGIPRGELLALIRRRQELLLELDRDTLLDVVVWARIPVRKSAGKEELARQIATITSARFDGLSERGLRALARLRGVETGDHDTRDAIEHRLRQQEGFWARTRRKRRRVVGSLVSKLLEGPGEEPEYQFLPENNSQPTLTDSIEDAGLVGGIAQKLRGAADHYVSQKLDEIEQRIDRKLDEIDRRLGEWRDQEIKNRLRIIKITLIAAIVVAIISLGYDYLKQRTVPPGQEKPLAIGSLPSAEG